VLENSESKATRNNLIDQITLKEEHSKQLEQEYKQFRKGIIQLKEEDRADFQADLDEIKEQIAANKEILKDLNIRLLNYQVDDGGLKQSILDYNALDMIQLSRIAQLIKSQIDVIYFNDVTDWVAGDSVEEILDIDLKLLHDMGYETIVAIEEFLCSKKGGIAWQNIGKSYTVKFKNGVLKTVFPSRQISFKSVANMKLGK